MTRSQKKNVYVRWYDNEWGTVFIGDHCFYVMCDSALYITCSIVVLRCYRRQAISMEKGEIRPSVTLYSFDRSLPNLVRLIT